VRTDQVDLDEAAEVGIARAGKSRLGFTPPAPVRVAHQTADTDSGKRAEKRRTKLGSWFEGGGDQAGAISRGGSFFFASTAPVSAQAGPREAGASPSDPFRRASEKDRTASPSA
jgi:hypothetical protein